MAAAQQSRIEQTIIKGVTVQVIVISDDEDDRAPSTRTIQAGSAAATTAAATAATAATATTAATSRRRVRFYNEESDRHDEDGNVTTTARGLRRTKHGHAATQAGSAAAASASAATAYAATAYAATLHTRLYDDESDEESDKQDDEDEEWVPARKLARVRKANSTADAFETMWDALWEEEITRTHEVVPQAAKNHPAHGPRIVPMTATPRTFVFKLK